MDRDTLKDIQYLLIMFEGSIEDCGAEAWDDWDFINLCNKYGFTKDNLHEGFEHLFC